jgi:hypothetical protein
MKLYEKFLLRKLVNESDLEEYIKGTQEGLDACLAKMNFDYEVREIYNKYGLKKEDYQGLRKIGKRIKAMIEISNVQNRNIKLKEKAEEVALENSFRSFMQFIPYIR